MRDTFAEGYSRTPEGWVVFPSDANYRKEMFPQEVNKHPAKANVFLIQAIVEYVSYEDDLILDPMSGTGTIMTGGLIGRNIICVEISEHFHSLQKIGLARLEEIAPGIEDHVSLVNLPCQQYLPIPELANHIVFSPPYASIMKKTGKVDKLSAEKMSDIMDEYSKHPLNLGLMNDFIWGQEMERIYKLCFDTLKPGGTMSLIVKDHYEKQKSGERLRIQLSQSAYDACMRIGFRPMGWFKWKAPGSPYLKIYKSRGWEVVEDEDIIIVRKEVIQ